MKPRGTNSSDIFAESNITGVNIEQVNPVNTESSEEFPDLAPSVTKHLLLVLLPLPNYVLTEVGTLIDKGAGKIEHEGPWNDGHLDSFPPFVDAE